ncbi:acyl carrier protein [Micromonospora wenchangensis]|uniref:Acyl carrier protein n=1 Tax=Micromonospora wenchangensis TaxID=1185415 RepID=A0A246RFH6_9ACTN|nr:acyl carrier protein [Micromonospora wenchangensis]
MRTVDDFVTLIRDELGLPVAVADLDSSLDVVAGWDSVHLLTLCTALERATGRPVSLPDVLAADSLAGIYAAAVGR